MSEPTTNDFKLVEGKGKALMKAFPGKYPVVITNIAKELPLKKRKFLVHNGTTFGDLAFIVRKHSKLEPHQAMFMYIGNILPASSRLICSLFDEHQEDNCLYLRAHGENTFG